MECREVGLPVDRREENGGGLDVFVVGGLVVVLFTDDKSIGEDGGVLEVEVVVGLENGGRNEKES